MPSTSFLLSISLSVPAEPLEPDEIEGLLAEADEHREVMEALAVPEGVDAREYAELLSTLFDEVLERAGLTPKDDDTVHVKASLRRLVVEHASPDDLLSLAFGQDLPADSPLLVALRGAQA